MKTRGKQEGRNYRTLFLAVLMESVLSKCSSAEGRLGQRKPAIVCTVLKSSVTCTVQLQAVRAGLLPVQDVYFPTFGRLQSHKVA